MRGFGEREREQGSDDNAERNKAKRLLAKQNKQEQAAVALAKAQGKGDRRCSRKMVKGAKEGARLAVVIKGAIKAGERS